MNPDERMPLTALVPELPGQPLELFDGVSAIRIALIDRNGVNRLSDVWDEAGVYLLLDPVSLDGTWGVYVGMAAAGLKTRVRQQIKGKESWNRAMLIRRDTTHGFNSAHVGWLEGYIHQLLMASALARPSNKLIPSDESLAVYEQHALLTCATGVIRSLRLFGYEPAAAADISDAAVSTRTKRQLSSTTFADLLAAGFVVADETLTSLNGIWPATATVRVAGEIEYDGRRYTSPSAAGSAVKKGGATNGWEFWGVQRDGSLVPISVIRARHDIR